MAHGRIPTCGAIIMSTLSFELLSRTRHDNCERDTRITKFTVSNGNEEVIGISWYRTMDGYPDDHRIYYFDGVLAANSALVELMANLHSGEEPPERFDSSIDRPEWINSGILNASNLNSWLFTIMNTHT